MPHTFQTRFHGRGGQGVVSAAEMLSVAAFREKKFAQAFPMFGSERMGAPVVSFCRISDHEIRSREPILDPDALIIQDPTLLQSPDLFKGLAAGGVVLINSGKELAALNIDGLIKMLPPGNVLTVPASEIAIKYIKRPLPNAAMLGGLAAMTGIVSLDSVCEAIAEILPASVTKANCAAAKASYEAIMAKRNIPAKVKRAC
ncbi:MAG: 2-oxoacid:acceptor oxidoreductase family protein [Alphaproteobacteria bacterium]|nr:2-oxoacid:acceptor oxidoreductase family protein [Alphaproteobacteria bacterium]